MQRVISSFIAAACFLATASAQGQGTFGSSFGAPDLLAPEQAFIVSQPQADVIEITIADGTYLYDDRDDCAKRCGRYSQNRAFST